MRNRYTLCVVLIMVTGNDRSLNTNLGSKIVAYLGRLSTAGEMGNIESIKNMFFTPNNLLTMNTINAC